ncbi:MAG: hypothetical protein HDS79_06855 [Bacteroidales bacterium]|nr:hypothetical protein [Bacteroidales bacterium]
MEEAITASIAPGVSAVSLAADVNKYLKEPEKRFRRIKEKMEDGTIKWHLSKPAKAYHPGRGVYRSSARNAQRLARTEINMAYRTAEQTRWRQFDFVVGYEVKTTQNGHHVEDICDLLAGKYPKSFEFKGWHPQCMCYAIPLLKTEEEFWTLDDDEKSVNEVTELPPNFREWIEDNKDRIKAAEERGKLPYFIRDNRERVDNILRGESTQEATSGAETALSQKEVEKSLNELLKPEKHYANPKLIRMMTGKEFIEKYRIVTVNEREVIVRTPSGDIAVDLRHGPTELYENLEIASDRMQRHGYQIRLCEKREDGKGADSFNVSLSRYEEYKVNRKGTLNSIDMNIKDAAKQADVILLKLNNDVPASVINAALRSRVRRATNVKEVIILIGEKEYILAREQILMQK